MNSTPSFLRNHLIPWGVCIIAAIFYGYDFFLRIMPSVMIQPLMNSYHVNAATIGLISAFYYYAYTPLQIPSGLIIDRFNTQIILLIALVMCVLGTFLFAYVPILQVAYLARMMMGIGSAFAFVGSLKLAARWLPRKQFALFSGVATSIGTIGAVGADWILSRLVTQLGWQSAVAVIGYVGIGMGILILAFVRNAPPTIELAESKLPKTPWSQSLKALWHVMKSFRFWINGFIGSVLFFPINVFASLWGVAFLIEAKHFSPTEAASITSLIFIGATLGAPMAGWFSDFVKSRRIPLFISAAAVLIISLLLIYTPIASHLMIYILLFLLGFFVGPQVLVFAVARRISPPHTTGMSTASTNFFVTLGAAILQPLIGILLDLSWSGVRSAAGTPIYSVASYKHAFLVLPIMTVLAFVLTVFIPNQPRTNN